MIVDESAFGIFERVAKQAMPGSTDEALFSGLGRLALEIRDIKSKLDEIEKTVRRLA